MEHRNKLTALEKDYLLYDIDTKEGQSGAPVIYDDQGVMSVVGIHKGFSHSNQLNAATPITP